MHGRLLSKGRQCRSKMSQSRGVAKAMPRKNNTTKSSPSPQELLAAVLYVKKDPGPQKSAGRFPAGHSLHPFKRAAGRRTRDISSKIHLPTSSAFESLKPPPLTRSKSILEAPRAPRAMAAWHRPWESARDRSAFALGSLGPDKEGNVWGAPAR